MKNILFTLAFGSLLALSACQKNVDQFVPDGVQTAPDTEWKSVITASMPVISLKNDLRYVKVLDSFSYNNSGVVYNSGSLSLGIPSNGLVNASGMFPYGNLVRQSLLVQKKGDLITMNMPSVNNDGRLMISGGAFFMGLRNNNEDLSVTNGNTLTVKYSHNATLSGMKVFNATEDVINGFSWAANPDIVNNKVTVTGNGYEVLTNRLQWVQAAYLFDTTGIPETSFSVKLPVNYTNGNTLVYISFNNMQCVADMKAHVNDKKFVSGDLPVNRPVTIIVLSKQANDYYLGYQQTVTAVPSSGLGIQEIVITPVRSPLANIRSYLNSL